MCVSEVSEGTDVKSERSVTKFVCVYGCALCGMTGVKKRNLKKIEKLETWRKSEKREKHKKSCYSVRPARALRINLAGVTVPDLEWWDIADPDLSEWFISETLVKALLSSFIQRQTACVPVYRKKRQTCHPPEGKSVLQFKMYLILSFEFCRAVKDFLFQHWFMDHGFSLMDGWMASSKSLYFNKGKLFTNLC